jgi:hypothetical protein
MPMLKEIAIALYPDLHQALEKIAPGIINPYRLISSKVPTRISTVARKNKMQIRLT